LVFAFVAIVLNSHRPGSLIGEVMITIHTLLIGQSQLLTDGRGTWQSAIFRTPTAAPVALSEHGLAGDQVADTAHHGSRDQAVCCHPLVHYEYWNRFYAGDLGERRLGPGSVGENWTLSGISEVEACVGDVYATGEVQVQISAPRYPCSKQERKVQLPGFRQRTVETLRTGWYLRVLAPGTVQAGDELRLVARPQPDLTIQRVNENMHTHFDPLFAQKLLDTPELAAGWKRMLVRKLAESE
jgi:MOSC domain-containing protein YiiM